MIRPNHYRHSRPETGAERRARIRANAVNRRQVGRYDLREIRKLVDAGEIARHRTSVLQVRIPEYRPSWVRSEPRGRTLLVVAGLPSKSTRRGEKGRQSKPNRARR